MQQATRVCFYCLHKIWLLLAIGLVLLATLVSVLRLALPYADSYKHHLENLLANQLGTPVQIAEISAGWQKLGPAMVLNQMQLGSPQQGVQLSIEQTRVHFDFWQSLRSLQLRAEHFELRGLRYAIDSSTLLNRPQTNQPLDAVPAINALEQLFFRQLNHFTLLDSELVLTADGSDDIVISVDKLDWRNEGERHQGIGELAVADITGNTLSFIIDLYGPSLDQAFGQIFLESRELDILPWFQQSLPQTGRLDQADINFQAWGRVDKGEIQRFQIELADNSLSWQRQGQAHQLKLGPGQLLWYPTENGWSLYSGPLALSDGQALWPELTVQLHKKSVGWHGQLQQLKLDALAPLSQLLSDEIPQLARLTTTELQGELNQAQWQLQSRDNWQLQGQLTNLSKTSSNELPGLNALDGKFWAASHAAGLTLSGQQSELQWPGMFSAPIPYQQLQLSLLARKNTAGIWQIQLPSLQLDTADFSLTGSMQWSMQQQPELSLFAVLTGARASEVGRYLPLRYLPEKTREYLSNAIIDGQLEQAAVLWQGQPAQYPFADAEGIFQVEAKVNDASFQFNPQWPSLEQLNSRLWFENAAMQISTDSASIAGIPLQGVVKADIANLLDAEYLTIEIDSELQLSEATGLINASPLRDNLGKVLRQLAPTGAAQADIALQLGLRQPAVEASGTITLDKVSLDLTAPQLAIRQLTGEVSFRDSDVNAENLKFNWRELPVTASLDGQQQADYYQFNLAAEASNGSSNVVQALWPDAAALVRGELDWQLALALQLQSDDFSYNSTLSADLTNTALLLPAPYQKATATRAKLNIGAEGNSQQGLLSLNYADQLYFTAELDHTDARVRRANLSLGPENAGINGPHFTIDVDVAHAELLPWQQLLSEQLVNRDQDDSGLMPPLSRVRGRIAKLGLVAGSALTNTVFELEPGQDAWHLRLHGTEIASRWAFSHDWQQQGLRAEIDYLHLPLPGNRQNQAVAQTPSDEAVALATPDEALPQLQASLLTLPPLTVKCNDCSVGNYQFGRLELAASGQDDHWQLSEFNSRYKDNELAVQGNWFPDEQLGVTELSGRFQSPNLGALLNELQLTTGISGSRADMSFKLNWPAAPTQFELAKLNGQLQFNLGEGALTEVSDQGARLFSIFSLDSLVRKLRLDFRDVFSKGFFYNKMSGDLAIHKGVVQTSDTTIDGVPGNLAIQGYADLVNSELDYQMSFSPKVTSSLPVIIAWMVNPATGLAALALDEVFQSAEVISRINFTVTGTFEQPVVTEVNRHSTEVPVPVRIAQPETVIDLEEQQPRGD
ncbi:TIGR02099 family protein [Arsukibacterium tuosuense]|uniref:TIGR02099 family protein n=1 Tax=Arsukibacterium tuosuense TaxID=1323745 RepID=A0A285JE30_9GAMM|nr:YhdP family protein [Arsukibacterium tuosuense]SNY58333.1 TIGR02099 family protein [Arsukibacterium tuosuense]